MAPRSAYGLMSIYETAEHSVVIDNINISNRNTNTTGTRGLARVGDRVHYKRWGYGPHEIGYQLSRQQGDGDKKNKK